MDTLQIFRGTSPFYEIKLDNDSNQSKAVMGDNVINLHFFLSVYINFSIGDYCTVFDEVYKLNEIPVLKKTASNQWEYTLKLESESFDLGKAMYFFFGPDNNLTESEFYLFGNADTFMDLLIQNINRISSGWEKGEVVTGSFKNLGFSGENCFEVLARLAEEFKTEYWIEGKKIHLVKKTRDTGFTLQVGYNKGLYEILRANIDSTRVITRLYAYGADKNLPTTYDPREKRLHLPPQPSTGNDCLISDLTWFKRSDDIYLQINWQRPIDPGVTSIEMVYGVVGSGTFPSSITCPVNGPALIAVLSDYSFDAKFISHGGACEGQETTVVTITGDQLQPLFPFVPTIYLEKNVDKYGIIEDRVLFDDIYPHRTGMVSSVDGTNPFVIIDAALDFNLNSYFQLGLTAQITFLTGQLAGYSFDISAYDNGLKKITFLKYKNEQTIDIPSSLIKPAIGDQYTLTNITMPTAYIEAAEAELLLNAKKTLDIFCQPQYTIQAVLDTNYMKNYSREVFAGDTVWIKDTQLEIDRKIRIASVIRNLVEPYQFQITLSDVIEVGTKDRIFSGISSAQRSTTDLGNQVVTRDIFNGNLVLPTSPGGAGFEPVIIDTNTNKLYRQE
jgi:hypothetical protein